MMRSHVILSSFFCLLISVAGHAQEKSLTRGYYLSYDHQLTTRAYFSRKFTTVSFRNHYQHYTLNYQPNTTWNLGVGATYKWATLNLAYGFGFLNPDRGRGKTHYLDLQFHSYGRKVSVDVLGQFYRGFYLSPKGEATTSDRYYQRPDLKVRALGATVQYIFNHKKFSYRASFLQNEWQQQSAGTILAGGELYAGSVRADSSMVPGTFDQETATNNIQRISFVEFGPNGGYAYTYVYKQHYFLTAAGSVSLDIGWNTLEDNTHSKTTVGFNPNTLLRFSGGYNSTTWAFSILYVDNVMRLAKNDLGISTRLRTGNIRLNVVYRFKPSKKVRAYLKAIDEVKEEIAPE
jgi:hypothetical protein